MSIPLWGQLQKAQDDPETIEEAIIRLINEHAADPTAHLGSGESLNAHKTDDVIDHPAFSVVTDKVPDGGLSYRWFPFDRQVILSNLGEEGWGAGASTGGNAFQYIGKLYMSTDDTTNSYAYATPSFGDYAINWDYDWIWQSTLSITSAANVRVNFGFCNGWAVSGDNDGVFFRVDDGTFYVGISDAFGDEILEEIDAFSVGNNIFHTFRIMYIEAEDTLYFFVDGEPVFEWASPSKKGEAVGFANFEIITHQNSHKYMQVSDFGLDVARQGA